MPYCPCFFCNNTSCRLFGKDENALPYPSLPKTKPDPKPWPTDAWQALLVCPECKQFRTHTKADIVWRARTDEDCAAFLAHTAWFSVRFECVGIGCGTPIELHVVNGAGTPIQAIDSMLRSGGVEGLLPCGHPFVPPPAGKCRIAQEPLDQPIRSYSQ